MTVRSDTFGLYSDTTISAADSVSQSHEVGGFTEAVITLNVTAVVGTNPTLDLDVEISDNEGSTFFKHEDITQIITTGRTVHRVTAPFGSHIRINNPATPGGTDSPSFTLTSNIMVKGT